MQVARQISNRAGHKQKRHRREQVALLIALIHTASDNKGGLKRHPAEDCNNIGGKLRVVMERGMAAAVFLTHVNGSVSCKDMLQCRTIVGVTVGRLRNLKLAQQFGHISVTNNNTEIKGIISLFRNAICSRNL